jgi:predicted DNA-binding antitoxin AbrB/MazE fold protein
MGTIHAVYEDGVFKPTGPVPLPDSCEVEFEPRVVAAPGVAPPALRSNDRLTAEEWVAEWRAWAAAMPNRPVSLDDSRESIYDDRG